MLLLFARVFEFGAGGGFRFLPGEQPRAIILEWVVMVSLTLALGAAGAFSEVLYL
jgi:hypothetical protein